MCRECNLSKAGHFEYATVSPADVVLSRIWLCKTHDMSLSWIATGLPSRLLVIRKSLAFLNAMLEAFKTELNELKPLQTL